MVKSCPSCGEAVAPGAARFPSASLAVAELAPKALRREIHWGVFQGSLRIGGIGLAICLVFRLILGLLSSGTASGLGG
jgi:hypothetical protein